jgi:hypothetical protein
VKAKGTRSADSIARDHAEEALDVLVEVMRDPLSEPRDRLKAANDLLERGYGKATQAIIAIPATKKLVEQAAAMTDDQLYEVIRAEPLPRLGAPAVDADYEEIDPLLL